jgi:hypothetical protein
MANEMRQRFIDLLEQDAAQANKVAQAWKELEGKGALLEDAKTRGGGTHRNLFLLGVRSAPLTSI